MLYFTYVLSETFEHDIPCFSYVSRKTYESDTLKVYGRVLKIYAMFQLRINVIYHHFANYHLQYTLAVAGNDDVNIV